MKVTRRGQTTIPKKLRDRMGIREGDELLVEPTEPGILLRAIPRLEDLAGIDAEFGKVDAIIRKIEKLREEYRCEKSSRPDSLSNTLTLNKLTRRKTAKKICELGLKKRGYFQASRARKHVILP